VRDWLKELSRNNRRTIGRDIATLQLGWPLGMPLARKMEPGLWEVRSRLDKSIARVLFTIRNDSIILLHAYIKKTQNTPVRDLQLARRRLEAL
jgi:phage-related protein